MPTVDASEKRPSTTNTLQSSTRSQSTANRFSTASTETGESSRSASTKASTLIDSFATGENDTSQEDQRNAHAMNTGGRDVRRSHRRGQNRSSSGFLLSNTAPGLPASGEHSFSRHGTTTSRPIDGIRSQKSKSSKDEKKKRAGIGLGIVGSPLASNVTSVGSGEQGDAESSNLRNRDPSKKDISANSQGSSNALDIDSAQIVGLALGLSEGRKLAARRNISTPIPPSTGFEDTFAGGSLKYHLQQQRRSSRNISPKPDKADRTNTTSPRLLTASQRTNSGLRGSSSAFIDSEYHYNFSSSTLARAEKARNAIELMAQYRRLLQYVPPLKPTGTSLVLPSFTPPGTSSNSPGSTTLGSSRPVSSTSTRPLGRPYNPLQYIRNRKLRARERRTLDGESEGFGDIDKVKAWVDQISSESVQQGYGTSDIVPIPHLPGALTKTSDLSHESPQSSHTKNANQSKYKRPRMDWIFTPEDLLSDLHWLEQGDNKKCIEDREGRKIFPQKTPLKRPMSRESHEPSIEPIEAAIKIDDSVSDHQVDPELPKFKSVKPETTRGRARQKIHDTIHGHHRHSGSFSDVYWKNKSDSDLSRSEDDSRFRKGGRSRSPPDPGRSLLEKQMMELLAKEAKQNGESSSLQGIEATTSAQPVEAHRHLKDRAATSNSAESSLYSSRVTNHANHRKIDSKDFAIGRSSLEVPYARTSFEGFDSTAPNSPLAKASTPEGYIPNINMNPSPTPSRNGSPTRKPLQKVRTKINQLRDRSRHPTNEPDSSDRLPLDDHGTRDTFEAIGTPISPVGRNRSISPTKKLLTSTTDGSAKSLGREGSTRRKKGEEDSSGIRGLIKGGRHIVRGPVSQVKDMLWKKDASPGSVNSAASSDEDSIDEAVIVKRSKKRRESGISELNGHESTSEIVTPSKSYLMDMPSFHLSRDRHRLSQLKTKEILPLPHEGDHVTRQRRALSNSRSPRFDLLKPPRIDVQTASPTSSPDFLPRQASHDSDVSDIESRRNSFVSRRAIYGADTRLDAILGLPGHLVNGPPMTSLAQTSLEKGGHTDSHDEMESHAHRPSLGGRQWSISDRAPSHPRGPITKREIARVRALLLSTGVKAKEIARREEELIDIRDSSKSSFSDVTTAMLSNQNTSKVSLVPKYREHALAASILSKDIQLSAQTWQLSANTFSGTTVPELTSRIQLLKENVTGSDGLTARCRKSADEADLIGKELVGDKTMAVKRLTDAMEMMQRRRRRRLRWVRRGGWVALEWVLVGVMWWVWLIVVLIRTVRGLVGAVIGGVRWLFWL